MKIKWVRIFGLLFFSLFVFSATKTWHSARLDFWLQSQVANYSKKNLPLFIKTSRTEFQVFPPQLFLNDVSLVPQNELKSQLQPFHLKKIKIAPSLFHLLIGRLHLALIEVDGASLEVDYVIQKSQTEFRLHLDKILQQIPITQVIVKNVYLKAKILNNDEKYQFKFGPTDATITNDLNNLLVKLRIQDLKSVYQDIEVCEKTFFETHFFLTEKNLVLSDFKIKEKDSYIVASGSTEHSLRQKELRSGKLSLRAFTKAAHARQLYGLFKVGEKTNPLDPLDGSLKTDLRFEIKDLKDFSVKTKTSLLQLKYDNLRIGDVDVNGEYDHKSMNMQFEKVKVKNTGLNAEIGPSLFNLKSLGISETAINIHSFSLQPFLKYSIQKEIPAHADLVGATSCSGALDPFKIECTGQLEGQKIKVNPQPERPLIELSGTAKLKGSLSISAKDLSYRTAIDLGHSQGESDGNINFKNGFKINYSTTALDFAQIQKISGLEVGGVAKIKGSTEGNSEAATFELALDGKDILFEKYKLGDLSMNLKYQKGLLSAQKIQGSASSSRYLGQLLINFPKNTISGRIQFPFIDLAVTQDAIKENLNIPVALSGSGAAVVQLDSPLNPNKLSFKAKARLYNCTVGQQHIETADIDVTSELGLLKINNAVFEEKNTNVQFQGDIYLDRKEYNLQFQSARLYLDDIFYITKYSTPTRGLFTANGKITGPFVSPNLDFAFSSENFYLANKKISPIKGNVVVYSNKTVAEINGPDNLKFIFRDIKNVPDYHIEGTTQNFDAAPIVTSLLQLKQIDDFKISLSSNFNLKVPKTNPEQMSGYLFLQQFVLDTEKNKLSTDGDVSLFFTNGKVNFSTFEMRGSGGQIKVKSNPTTLPLDIHLSGLFSLSFIHIFTPFLETIEGQTTVNFRIQKKDKLEFFGSAFIDDGFIKLPDIQHAVESLKVDVLFNQDRININSLKAKFASGQMLGDGYIRLVGPQNVPIHLNLHLDNVDLNIPPQVNTVGNADLKLTGQWLPFRLSGTYKVIDGLITKELSGDDVQKQSAHVVFLPQALRTQDTSPLDLDLQIVPVTPIKIKNSLVDGKIQGEIHVAGAPQSPILGGNISFTKFSQIIFRDVTFRVRDSNIVLNNTNPPNPSLYILADARYKGYDIEMLVQGYADKPKFSLTSQPALTQPEIISLLALGYTTNEQTTNTQNNQNTGANADQSLQVGTGVFGQNPLGKEFKNRFGVDVQFSSRFDSNSSVAVPTIGFSKRISERTSFVGSVQTGKDNRADGKIRYELDRGFAATISLQSQGREEANQVRGNNISDILGIDLEFRKEFK